MWYNECNSMSKKHTQKMVKFWASMSKEKRHEILSRRAKLAWSRKSKEERKARSKLMEVARLKK